MDHNDLLKAEEAVFGEFSDKMSIIFSRCETMMQTVRVLVTSSLTKRPKALRNPRAAALNTGEKPRIKSLKLKP